MIILLGYLVYSQNIIAGILPDSSFQISEKRMFPNERSAYYQNLPEYSYSKSLKYDSNFFKRAWDAFIERLRRALGLSSKYGVNRLLFYLAICLALIGLIYHLMRSQGTGMWHRKSFGVAVGDAFAIDDHLSMTDINKKISDAIKEGKYRLAVRYNFIKVIMALDSADIIKWKPELSNSTLLAMISQKGLKKDMNKLIIIYEHTWYGKYEIDQLEEYRKYQEKFDSLTDSLTSSK